MNVREMAEDLSTALYSLGYYKFADQEVPGFRPSGHLRSDLGGSVQTLFSGISVAAVGYSDDEANPALFVYATRVSKAVIRSFPTEIGGYPATIANFGSVNVKPESALRASTRPKCYTLGARITCGSSVAPSGAGHAGTFGAICRSPNGLFGLSNNHVFAECNHAPIDHPILSPSANDTGADLPYPRALFKHTRFAPLHSGDPFQMAPTKIDAAIAEVLDESSVSSNQGTYYDTPTHVNTPIAGLKVKKVGRTTGLTSGVIESRAAKVLPIPYKSAKFKATVYFDDVWFVNGDDGQPFAAPGDSGSLVVSESGDEAVGLLFAVTSIGLAVIIPIEAVLQYFGLELVNGVGT